MAINKTDWQIIVHARTQQAQKAMAGLAAQAKTAEGAFNNFSNVSGTVTQELKNTPRVFDKIATQVKSGKMSLSQYGRAVKHTNMVVKRQNQLQNGIVTAASRADGSIGKMAITMQKFGAVTTRVSQRIGFFVAATRAMATGMVDFGKNMQWAGRQIMVGFTVPFGIAMLAASKTFTDFEDEVIRFRKVFNEELGTATEVAEERVIKLANTMATQLGYARNDILETAATFAQMGKNIDEVERLTEATTKLSLLGEVPKETATQLIRAYAASGFDEMAGGIENVVNHLNALENSTSLTTEMMASALPQIIPIFEQMNLQFGEGEAIIAGMTESLGSANQSVNALKMGLQRVYKPTRAAIDAFDDVGINLLEIRKRNENDVIGFFGELGDIMEGQIDTNTEFAETIGQLFGVRRAGHLATALRSINDAQSDFARGMQVTMNSAEENAVTAAEEIDAQVESINGRLKRLKETILVEITDIGRQFLEMAMPYFEMIGDLIKRFNDLGEGTKKWILRLGAFSGIFAGAIMMAGIFINLLGMTIKAFFSLLPVIQMVTEEERSMTAMLKMYANTNREALVPMNARENQHRQNAAAMNLESESARRLGHNLRQISTVSIGNRGVLPMAGGGGFEEGVRQGTQGPGATVKWRKGAMIGGAAMMGASMMPGIEGDTRSTLMGGAMGIEGIAMLSMLTGKGKGLKNIVSRMKDASSAAGGMAGKLGKGAAAAKVLGAGLATSTGVIAAVAGGAFLIYKHVQNAKKEAAKLRNEFQLSGDIAEDLGLELERAGGSLSRAWGGQTKEEAEELSDSMQIIVDRVAELRGQEGGAQRIQAMFRNMAREWLSGGATIDEINEKLNELEAIVGVSIDEASRASLRQNISRDIHDAINDALMNFSGDPSFWRSIFTPGVRFSYDDEESVRNSVQSLLGGIQSSMDVEGGVTDIGNMLGEFYKTRSAAVGDDTKALEEFNRIAMETMALRFNIPQDHAEELRSVEETFSYVYTRLASDKDTLIEMSETERDSLYELAEAYGEYELRVRDVNVTDEDFIQSQDAAATAINQTIRELNLSNNAMSDLNDAALSPLAGKFVNFTDLLERGSGTQIADTARRLEGLKEQFSGNAEMVEYLDVVTRELQKHLSAGFIAPFEIIPMWRIDALEDRERHRKNMAASRNFGKEAGAELGAGLGDGAEEGAEDAGKDAAASYINAFRSELDKRRDDIINDILSQYDEQTDTLIENLEEQRDAEVDSYEDRIDAIDEYLDKQQELEDSLNKQLDLILAIAGGDVDRAAQLQNEMMFQGIEEVAEAEKENIERSISGVESEYDNKIKHEQEYRDEQRKTLEEQLELTKEIFIGTEQGWNRFLGEVGRTAQKFDTSVDKNLTNGWNKAMDKIVSDARLDNLWDTADFSGLRARLKPFLKDLQDGVANSVEGGFVEGGLDGSTEVTNSLDRYIQEYIKLLDAGGGGTTAQDEGSLIRMLAESNMPKKTPRDFSDYEAPKSGGFLQRRHSGGPIGPGAPKDVPIIAQTGEYVIQRKAVKKLGMDTLEQLNNYHVGGIVGLGQVMGARMAAQPATAVMDSLPKQGSLGPRTLSVDPTSTLQPPDKDWTSGSSKYYGGWTYGLQQGIARKVATQLASLSGGQAIVNAYRDAEHNRRVGGAKNSDHRTGKAIDFVNAEGATTPQWVDRMGAWFESQSGVRWVGRPATDRSGGHDDHVHVSYLHGGGPISLMKGGKVMEDNTLANLHRGELVVRRPLAESLEAGIQKLNNGDTGTVNHFEFNIEHFGGSPAEAKKFARQVEEVIDRKYRKGTPTRSIK